MKILKPFTIVAFVMLLSFGLYSAYNFIHTSSLFSIKSIEVKGVINADRAKLTEISKKIIGMNIFDERIDDILKSDDDWVQKLVANRKLPNSVNIIVFEEIPIFSVKQGGQCFTYTLSDKRLDITCEKVNVNAKETIDKATYEELRKIFAKHPQLRELDIDLNNYSFIINFNNQKIICPYDEVVFSKNFDIYTSSIMGVYKNIDYVDLTIDSKVYVKGERHGSNKG